MVYTFIHLYIYICAYGWMRIMYLRIEIHGFISLYIYTFIHLHMCVWVDAYYVFAYRDLYIYTFTYVIYVFEYRDLYIRFPACPYIRFPACLYVWDIRVGYLYGVATMSRLLKIIGLFCRISSLL